jgi:hypothetical protein
MEWGVVYRRRRARDAITTTVVIMNVVYSRKGLL